MIRQKVLAAYEAMAENYSALIDDKPHNAYYDRPNTLSLLPAVQGKNILDAACGPGKYAEILLSEGAAVTGFDFSPKMVELAVKRNKENGCFFVQDLALPFTSLQNESFDIVLCALALQYIEDWTLTIQEFYRVLKPGGLVVISIEHPFFDYLFFKAANYFATTGEKCVWKGFGNPVEVNSYRRSLTQCISPLTENGFYIDKLLEPLPVKEFQQRDPKHYKELSAFPAFLCIRASKH